jgi:hypothetical protein
MYRVVVVAVTSLTLTGCAKRSAETDAVAARAHDCLVLETRGIAAQPVDLETATFAVLARCDYPGVLKGPGQRNIPDIVTTCMKLCNDGTLISSTPRDGVLHWYEPKTGIS